MIRTEKEYKDAVSRLQEYKKHLSAQKNGLLEKGLSEQNAEFALQPAKLMHEQLKFDVEQYERTKRGDIDAIRNLDGIGPMLIAVRISLGLSQRELAERLGVSEAQVSKDERHEYAGVSVEKVQKILNTMGVSTRTEVVLPADPTAGRITMCKEEAACTL